jgi:hypothetical protein
MAAGCDVPSSKFSQAQKGLNATSKEPKDEYESFADIPDCQTYFKKIDDELFIDGCATKFDLRHFNFLAVKDIQIVFVSTFQELYGAPFLSMHPQFKGKIYMT